jgi:hypothetical protein
MHTLNIPGIFATLVGILKNACLPGFARQGGTNKPNSLHKTLKYPRLHSRGIFFIVYFENLSAELKISAGNCDWFPFIEHKMSV